MADMDPISRWANGQQLRNPNVARGVMSADAETWQKGVADRPAPTLKDPAMRGYNAPAGGANGTGQITAGSSGQGVSGRAPGVGAGAEGVGTATTAGKAGGAGASGGSGGAVSRTLREGLAAQNGALAKGAYVAGKAARVLGPAATGADVISHFNDYKINDPEVDSSAKGTWNALRQGDFSGAGRSASKGMLETGMDLGSAAANTLDLVVPGKALVSRAYDRMLRGHFGDQLVGGVGTPSNPKPNSTRASAPTAAAPTSAAPAAPATPATPPRVQFFPAGSAGAIAANKNIDSRSYVPGDGQGYLRNETTGGVTQFNTGAPGASAPVDPEVLRRAYAPTDYSRADRVHAAPSAATAMLNSTPKGWVDEVVAAKRARLDADRAVQLRGQDITARGQDMNYDASMYGHNISTAGNRARLQYDMYKDQRDMAFQRGDKQFEQNKAREEMFDKQIADRFSVDGKRQPQMEYEYKQFMQNGIANAAKPLVESDDPKMRELGQMFLNGGYKLDAKDMQELEQAWQLRGQMKDNAGGLITQWLLNKGRYIDSHHPQDFAPNGVDERTWGGDHVTTRNGSSVSVNDLRGSTLGVFPANNSIYEEQIRRGDRARKLREGN